MHSIDLRLDSHYGNDAFACFLGRIRLADGAAKSSTRRGPRIIGRLLFAWSWFVAGALLLFFAPPVLA